jgi:hypothetical protein
MHIYVRNLKRIKNLIIGQMNIGDIIGGGFLGQGAKSF